MRSRLLTEIGLVVIVLFALCLVGRPFSALLILLGYLGWKLRYVIKYFILRGRNKISVNLR